MNSFDTILPFTRNLIVVSVANVILRTFEVRCYSFAGSFLGLVEVNGTTSILQIWRVPHFVAISARSETQCCQELVNVNSWALSPSFCDSFET